MILQAQSLGSGSPQPLGIQAAVLRPLTGGSVINISSFSGTNPTPNSAVYSTTKSAVDSLTLALSREPGARKIRVNATAPGGVETEGLHRIAVFLASDEAAWLTGELISASGDWRQ
jgi:3-oxoacyl-[acyl-carrier protein] reductase